MELWRAFQKRRTEEIKEEQPDLPGKERQALVRSEWAESEENPQSNPSSED